MPLTLAPASNCDICFEEFGQDQNVPCAIRCGHIYCVGCISKINSCPLCRTVLKRADCTRLYIDVSSSYSEQTTKNVPNDSKIKNVLPLRIEVFCFISTAVSLLVVVTIRLKSQNNQLLVENAELLQRLKESETTQDVDPVVLFVFSLFSILTALGIVVYKTISTISGILNAVYLFLYPVAAVAEKGHGIIDEDDNDEGHGMRIHHPDSPSSSSLPDMPSSSSSSSLSPASLSIGTSSDHEGPSVPASQEPRVEPLNSSTTTTPEGDSHLLSSGPHLREERKKGWRGFMGDVFIWKRKAGHAR